MTRRSAELIAVALGVGFVFLLRWGSRHAGLIYPDGYQYLLMAKGIATHLTPTLRLGGGGELFVPSLDAGLKPLFPALVALTSVAGSLRTGADVVTALAAAATVILTGIVAARLTRSRTGGALAALAALTCPIIAYWAGFTGPDTLGGALALATGLALLTGKVRLAGVLGALCISARPEFMIPLLAGGVVGVASARTREQAGVTLLFGAFTLAGVMAVLRSPIGSPPGGVGLLIAAIAATAALLFLAQWAAASRTRALAVAGLTIAGVAAVGVSGRVPALGAVWHEGWPLLVLAACGLLVACARPRPAAALTLLASVLALGCTYAYRNDGSVRYLAILLPALCVMSGYVVLTPAITFRGGAIGVLTPAITFRGRAIGVLAPVTLLAIGLVLEPPRPQPARDTFSVLAAQMHAVPPGTLVSAAPDAYGYLLPRRPQRTLAPGLRGLILLDPAQRVYSPGLTARGTVIARLRAPSGFERPDGTLDMRPALLVRGVVVRTG